ncbi:MAG: hypothetical protein DBX37_06675, partial [Massilioclostridium sp.]
MNRKLRKIISAATAAAILASSLATGGLTVSAAAPSEPIQTFQEVWGMEDVTGEQLRASIGDAYGMIRDNIFTLDIAEGKGVDGSNAIAWTNTASSPNYSDIDLRYHELENRQTDWSGAEEVWFHVDFREYGTMEPQIRFAFQETVYQEDGTSLNVQHALSMKSGALYYYNDGLNWIPGEVDGSQRMTFPVGFNGWVRIPLDMSTFSAYWNGYDDMYLKDVNQLNMHIVGNDTTLNKTAYLDSFGIVGQGFSDKLPSQGNYSYKEMWGVEGITDLPGMLGDFYGMLNKYYDLSVSEDKGFNGSSALAWKINQSTAGLPNSDVDIRLWSEACTIKDTNGTGAEELWFYADATEFGDQPTEIRFAFQEDTTDGFQHALQLVNGTTYQTNDGKAWTTKKVENNLITLDAGFKGWVRIPLSNATFTQYWSSGGNVTTVCYSSINQFNMHVNSNDSNIGKTLYLDGFGFVGNVNGVDLPVEPVDPTIGAPIFNQNILNNPNLTCYKNGSTPITDASATSETSSRLTYRTFGASHGQAYINQDSGMLLYIPNQGFSGTDTFTVRVTDEQLRMATIQINVTVSEETDPNAGETIDPPSPEYPETPDAPTMPKPDTERAVSLLKDFGLEGYVGENIQGNIDQWQVNALKDNPNIIEQIESVTAGDGKIALSSILSDASGALGQGIYKLDINESKGYDGTQAVQWTSLKNTPLTADTDVRFVGDSTATIDWTGAKEVWFYLDNTEMTSGNLEFRFAFEEQNITGKKGRESWQMKDGSKAYLCGDGVNWTESTVSNRAFLIPAQFKGWIKIALTPEVFEVYWDELGEEQHTIDLKDVHQFQLRIHPNEDTVDKSFYLDNFAIVGNVNGTEAAPVAISSEDSFKTVWNMDSLKQSSQYTGALVAWYDEFPGKLLTGISYSYLLNPDPDLLVAGNELADAMTNAQGKDGYLGIYAGNSVMGGQGSNWDVWGHYHSIYGLYNWYKITGNQTYLNTAIKAADYVYKYFIEGGRTFDSAGSQTMNLGISHGFAVLYQETGDVRYLNAARQIVVEDWPRSGDWLNNALNGNDYYQSPLPRWEALHTIITLGTLYEVDHNDNYYNALQDIWYSIQKTDVHNTGGFTSGEQACGDPYNTGAIETCCTVAWMALSTEYLQLSHDSFAADQMEISYFNGMLGSLLNNDKQVTYNTPMNGSKGSSQEQIAFQYNSGSPDFNCCQANAARGLGELSQWGVLTNNTDLYLNYYGPSHAHSYTPAGNPITIHQETNYPKDGAIKITLDLEQNETFNFNLRIPVWAMQGNTLKINGESVSGLVSGEYYTMNREWKNGDTLELNLDIAVHYWVGEKNFAGKTSVYYGPILLAYDTNYNFLPASGATLQTSDLENMKVVDGSEEGCWLFAETKTINGIPVKLVDFASCGQDKSNYETWLNINHTMDYIPYVQGGNPIWNNTPNMPSYTVTAIENNYATVTIEDSEVSFGGSTTFTVSVKNGKELQDILVNGKSIGAVTEYTLTNIKQDTTITVVLKGDKSILDAVIKYAEEQKASDDFNNVIAYVQESFNAALDAAKEIAA